MYPHLVQSETRQMELETAPVVETCGWCDRVRVGDKWVDAGQMIRHLRTFEQPTVPMFVQRICGSCERRREAKRVALTSPAAA